MPAVVTITAQTSTGRGPGAAGEVRHDSPRLSGTAAARVAERAGSGVIFDALQGFIITNNHVIAGADRLNVKLADGRELPARLLGTDPETDVAVIKVQPDGLTAISFADSTELEIGDFVLAIGNPSNMGESVTSGIVSGLHRNSVGILQYEDFIQTDAAIYPGNSGGALINLRGELVGINSAYIGSSSTNPGMGFAIPINMAREVADHIVKFGNARRSKIGIAFDDVAPTRTHRSGFRSTQAGPTLTKIDAGSPAARSGLLAGDVVARLAGKPVKNAAELLTGLALVWLGDSAEFEVLRAGAPVRIRVTLSAANPTSRQG
jgi:serine protease Do/serine protease DegQ